jgi:uncharacterized protein (DUF2384 family)
MTHSAVVKKTLLPIVLGFKRASITDAFDAEQWLADWMNSELPGLNGKRPSQILDAPHGLQTIANLLLQMEHGAYA